MDKRAEAFRLRRLALEDPPVIANILSHLGLPTRAPPKAPVASTNSPRQLDPSTGFRLSSWSRQIPFAQCHPHTHKRAPWWPNLKKMGPSDPTHRMNARMSDCEVRGLNPQHGFWYFAGQSKRPFIIPIPSNERTSRLRAWGSCILWHKVMPCLFECPEWRA